MNKESLRIQLRIDEGYRTKAYRDTVGKLSIGIGRNLDDRGLRESEILFMLDNDIDEAAAELDRALPWWRQMSEARQDVLVNMCFNLGITKLLGFKNTLAFMKAGNYAAAADGMEHSMWFKQVGERAERLVKIMRNG